MQPPAREAGCSERSARIESLSVAAAGGRSPNSRKDCHQLRRRSPLVGACTSRLVLDLKSLLAPVACTCRRSCADGAAGMWARQFSERAGVVCPNQAAEHYYLITGAMPDVDPSWPIIEDPSKCATVAHDLRRTACSTAHAAQRMQHTAFKMAGTRMRRVGSPWRIKRLEVFVCICYARDLVDAQGTRTSALKAQAL